MRVLRRVPALIICLAFLFSAKAQASCGQLFAVIERIDIVLDFDGLLRFSAGGDAPPGRLINLGREEGARFDEIYRIPDGLEEFLVALERLPGVRLNVLTAASSPLGEEISRDSDSYVRLTGEKVEDAKNFLRRVGLLDGQSALDLFSDGEGGYRVYSNGTATKDLRLIPGINLERAFLVDHTLSAPFDQGGSDQRRNYIRAADTAADFGQYPELIPLGDRNYLVSALRARNDLARVGGLIAGILRVSESDAVSPVEAWTRFKREIAEQREGHPRIRGLFGDELPGDHSLSWYLRGAALFREVNPGFKLTRPIYEEE